MLRCECFAFLFAIKPFEKCIHSERRIRETRESRSILRITDFKYLSYFLFKGNFFPAETPELSEEDDPNSLFLPTTIPKSAPPPPIPFTSYTHHRYPYWKALLSAEPWITIWWTTKAIGHIINTVWIWQDHEETDPKLKRLKRDLQEDISEALVKLVDSIYLNLVDCDVRLAGGSGGGGGVGVWGEGGGGGGNTCVSYLFA